jgi:hypothetical protein
VGANAWINELHYDDEGEDADEGVEVAGTAGLNLAGWQLVPYNGNGGVVYTPLALSGVIPDQGACLGTLWFPLAGLQNGAPDGVALVDASGVVVQFLSYEGTFTASDGPAQGRVSVDIGVSETGSTPNGHSLQLAGTGNKYADFTWQPAGPHTRGAVNTGQTFAGGCAATASPTPSPSPSPSPSASPSPSPSPSASPSPTPASTARPGAWLVR